MPRPDKVQKVEELAEVFSEARSVVLNDFTGLNVAKISELRKQCREAGVEYIVVKNRLAKRGIKGTTGEGRGFVLLPSASPYGRQIAPHVMANYETMIRLVKDYAG